MRLALLASFLVLVGCDKPASTAAPEAPSNVTAFHASIFNACTKDVSIEVAEQPNSGGRGCT